MTWLAALRDHPERPPVTQRMVLYCLAQRMDWSTGCGFASTAQLAGDADCSPPTVKRATGWGRTAGMLVQTRRGHRLGDGRTSASEWRLRLPVDNSSQGVTGETLNEISTAQPGSLNGSAGASQGLTPEPPSRPVNHLDLSSSLSEPNGERETDISDDDEEKDPDFGLLAAAVPGADARDIEDAVTALQIKHFHGEIRSVRAYLKTVIANGDAAALVSEAAAERYRTEMDITRDGDPFGGNAGPVASSCHSGDHGQCLWSWCTCRCHARVIAGTVER